jgi:hypothetical protein
VRISCLVDGRTGLGATSDAFDTVITQVSERDVLPCVTDEGRAFELGRRLAQQAPGARRRALTSPRRELLERGLLYKPFWVVRAGRTTILVDGITGGLHPIVDATTPASTRPAGSAAR